LSLLFNLVSVSGRVASVNGDAADRNATGIGNFKLIEAAKKRAFAATAWADQHDGFTALLPVINPVQNTV
jgi:hypothetical protein